MTHELPDESQNTRDTHIEIISENVNSILEQDFSDVTKDIAVDVAVGQLSEIQPVGTA